MPGGSPLPPAGGGAGAGAGGKGEMGALGGEAIGEASLLQPLDSIHTCRKECSYI